ncbi:MAG: ferritin-like domain-containing protein [Thermomicrobiales bacterium]|jgi:rubrerythrin
MRSDQYVEQLLSVVRSERRRLESRRGFLTSGAKIAGAGALVAAMPAFNATRALAQDFSDDVEILNYALTLEHLEYAFYRDGLQEFGLREFEEADRPDNVYPLLQQIRTHEASHVDALMSTISDLGGEPVEEGEYDFGYEDVDSFLMVAQALENTGVAAYAGAAPQIEDDELLATALSIHSVEARHASYLNARNDVSPFPDAFDDALSPDQVLEIASDFIVGGVGEDEGTPEG